MRKAIVSTFAIVLLVITACSSSPTDDGDPPGGDPPDNPPPGTVFVEPTSFRPASITVSAGEKVTWDNYTGDQHTITPIDHAAFQRVDFATTGKVLEVTFTTPGTYRYFCEYHGGMNGTVVVTAPTS